MFSHELSQFCFRKLEINTTKIIFFNTTWQLYLSGDVLLANCELHQACGHVMLSTWPKDGHRLSVSCTPLHLCSYSWVLSGSRSTPWPAWFSDVLLFPKFWHLTNLWHDFLSLHDLLWPTCSFLLPCSFGQYMYSRSCGMKSCTHILQFALLCVGLLAGLAVVSVSCRASWPYLLHIYGISSQQSQITLLHMGWLPILYSPVLTCFFYLCPLSFPFLLVTCSTSRGHKPDEARQQRAKRRN